MSGSGIICACCGHDISAETVPECDYCGYVNVGLIGKAAVDENKIMKYRKKIIEKLRDISIVSYQYGWNEKENKYMMLAQEEIKLMDGTQCDGTVFWAPQEFGQFFEDEEAITLELKYKYDGDERKLKYPIKPIPCKSFWRIGAEINEHLKLVVYLGDEKQNSRGYEVSFIKN